MTTQTTTRQATDRSLFDEARIYFDASVVADQVKNTQPYQRSLTEFRQWAADQSQDAHDFTTFARWKLYMVNQTTGSPKAINVRLSHIRSIMRSAAEVGYVSPATAEGFRNVRNVSVKALKSRLKTDARTALSPEQVRSMCNLATEAGTLVSIRDAALLHLFASSGARIGELVTLTQAQLKTHKGEPAIWIMGKNKTEPRPVTISKEAAAAVARWISIRGTDSPNIFTRTNPGQANATPAALTEPISPVTGWNVVKHYAAAAGIDANVKPHDFRRYNITKTAQRAGIRQAQLKAGHASISTTAGYMMDELEAGLTEGLY